MDNYTLEIRPSGNGYVAELNGVSRYFDSMVEAAEWADSQLHDEKVNLSESDRKII